jgi:hypothetical protein
LSGRGENLGHSFVCSGESVKKPAGYYPGRKDDGGKLRWNLLPVFELEDVVRVLTKGAVKYAPGNWMKVKPQDGQSPEERYKEAAKRHISEIDKGILNDPEWGFSHYAHAICSLFFAFWHSRNKCKKN